MGWLLEYASLDQLVEELKERGFEVKLTPSKK